jgi:hypothetical protein
VKASFYVAGEEEVGDSGDDSGELAELEQLRSSILSGMGGDTIDGPRPLLSRLRLCK